MSDILVTLPLAFKYGDNRGLDAWVDEGDAAGDPLDPDYEEPDYYEFDVWGPRPRIEPGERVYVCYDGILRGYAPLVELRHIRGDEAWGRWGLIRAGGAVAVTIDERIPGFRGWRYRWWDRAIERSFPDWKYIGRNAVPLPAPIAPIRKPARVNDEAGGLFELVKGGE